MGVFLFPTCLGMKLICEYLNPSESRMYRDYLPQSLIQPVQCTRKWKRNLPICSFCRCLLPTFAARSQNVSKLAGFERFCFCKSKCQNFSKLADFFVFAAAAAARCQKCSKLAGFYHFYFYMYQPPRISRNS